MPRIFAISDLHVDYDQNMKWVHNLSQSDFTEDSLIVAGDVSDDMDKMTRAMKLLIIRFNHVFFVPGNHDLWIRKDKSENSLEKFYRILNLCTALDINTQPLQPYPEESDMWVVPFFAWYVKPEEGDDSLFLPKPGEDPLLTMWVDNHTIRWPDLNGHKNAANLFLQINQENTSVVNDGPVISFSHFLPRQELIFGKKRPVDKNGVPYKDPVPAFNFSRVAGTSRLEKQLRDIKSNVHIYGHQHRNRFRKIDDVIYISHSLGYPKERTFAGISDNHYLPKLIWDSKTGFCDYKEN